MDFVVLWQGRTQTWLPVSERVAALVAHLPEGAGREVPGLLRFLRLRMQRQAKCPADLAAARAASAGVIEVISNAVDQIGSSPEDIRGWLWTVVSLEVMRPRRPTHMPEYAEACLQALAAKRLGEKMSLGGAFGLLHYLDYRPTHDVDAWWVPSATVEDRRRVVRVVEATLQPFGQVKTRGWGDVVSIELMRQGKTVFSFQIARRSAQLEPSTPAPWTNVLLDSFPDLVAGKMVALVERGARSSRHSRAVPSGIDDAAGMLGTLATRPTVGQQ